jgi:hypothetical protein
MVLSPHDYSATKVRSLGNICWGSAMRSTEWGRRRLPSAIKTEATKTPACLLRRVSVHTMLRSFMRVPGRFAPLHTQLYTLLAYSVLLKVIPVRVADAPLETSEGTNHEKYAASSQGPCITNTLFH